MTNIKVRPFIEAFYRDDKAKTELACSVLKKEYKKFHEVIGLFFGYSTEAILMKAYACKLISAEEWEVLKKDFLYIGNILINNPRNPLSEEEAVENFKKTLFIIQRT